MTDPEQDEVFEAYLKRRPVLPTLDDKVEPPATLDQRVLNQARDAIRPGATKSPLQRPPRWAVPVALAATILLCLSVVMNISLNTNRRSPNIERMTAARADVKASALSNATAESDAAAGVSARSPARDAFAANNGEGRESISGDIPSHEVVLPRAKVAGTPAPHAPVVAEASVPPAQTAGASGSVTAPAPPGSPVPASAGDAGVAAPQYTPAPKEERAAASARKAAKAAAVAPHPADPKVWLQQIDALRAAGRADQADAEMRRFKAVFPNYGTQSAPPDRPK